MPLLDIRHLTIEIETPQGMVKAVDRMSLTLNEGEIRGLVGESGSGKSLVAKAIVGFVRTTGESPRTECAWVTSTFTAYAERASTRHCPRYRDDLPRTSTCLDPSEEVGRQLSLSPLAPLKASGGSDSNGVKQAIALLHKVGIKDHKRLMGSYPYELTDGECQKS